MDQQSGLKLAQLEESRRELLRQWSEVQRQVDATSGRIQELEALLRIRSYEKREAA